MHANAEGESPKMNEPAAGYGVTPVDQMRTIDGLTLMRGILEGRYPAPPIAGTLGFGLTEVEAGRVAFAYEPLFEHYNPLGSVHGGIAATLLDSVMGCCIHTTLKAGTGYTTVEIKVNYVRAMTHKTGPVRAEGKVINVGSRIATSEGRLVDAAGKLLAHGTTTCLIFPI
jgi:uncharacterized protein (TIGR00369 family)